MANQQIENAFTYHPPKGDQAERYTEIRDKAKELALLLDARCPNRAECPLGIPNFGENR